MRIPNWYRVDQDGLRFYRAWNLQSTGQVEHGFSTRLGGTSPAPYDTLNLSLAVGDDLSSVLANRARFAAAMGADVRRAAVADQVHSNNVHVVTERDSGAGALDHASALPGTDALVTNRPGLPLALHFADCICIFLLDPVNHAIAAVHAGWRGTVRRVVTAAIDVMTREFGSAPAALLAAVGPAICRHCYEVGEDVAREVFRALPGEERVLTAHSNTKWKLDLKTANLLLLREAGVADANVAVSDACTSCSAGEFFSYRRDGTTGRMGGWIVLR